MKHIFTTAASFKYRWLLFSAVAFLLYGCYPDGGEYVEDFDAVYTNYEQDFNFNTTYTYSIPDKVMDLDDSEENDPEYIDQVYADAILNTVKANLDAMGWTEVSANSNPDIVVVAAAFDQTFISYNPWWWDWYYPWYGPDWGWYYPGYYPGYVSGYSSGSVLVQMTYPEDTNSDNEVPVVWLGALNGLLQGSESNILGRITIGLNTAFNHPPFNN